MRVTSIFIAYITAEQTLARVSIGEVSELSRVKVKYLKIGQVKTKK